MKTSEILNKYQFHIKKKYGQNFLTSEYILESIVNKAEITNETGVIEIGPGLGALTNYIAQKAKKVLCYEIDSDLLPILADTLKEYNNINILNEDILEANVNKDIDKYLTDCKSIYVIANLPYYITTPILIQLLEKVSKINKYVVMMQQEVAARLAGKASTKEYNSLSIAIQYRASVKKVLNVPRNVFIPAPNVDSAVLEIKTYDVKKYFPKIEWFFFDLVRNSFSQRRKTLMNNLINRYGDYKEIYSQCLDELNIKLTVRAEELSIDDFVKLSDLLYEKLSNKEILDVYDENGLPKGKTTTRGYEINEGEYTKIVMGIIQNEKDEFLIQKRSSEKLYMPGVWSITGGAVKQTETEIDAIKRECLEELGLEISQFDFVALIRGKSKLKYYYSCRMKSSDQIVLDIKEVSEYKFVDRKDLLKYHLSNEEYEILMQIKGK